MERDDGVWLYYVGYNGKQRIGLAISEDGVNFVKQGVALPLGTGGNFDDAYLYSTSVLERGGRMWMYYTGVGGDRKTRIGLAISEDGL